MPDRRGSGWSSVSALVLLLAIAGSIQPARGQAATAGCPTPPAITSTTYADAVNELKKKDSMLTPRARRVASAKPAGTILEVPKSELAGGTCYATFVVSDGSLAKAAAVTPAAKVKIIPDKVVKPAPGPQEKPPIAQPCPQIPSFSPQTLSAAQKALSGRHIAYRVEYRPSPPPRGDLLGAPQMNSKCIVTLVVSDGTQKPPPTAQPEKVCPPVPQLPAQTQAAAVNALRGQFELRVEVRPSPLRKGSLIEPPKAVLENGRCVATLLVSDGTLAPPPPPKTCAQAPSVENQAIATALKTLAERGFRAIRRDRPSTAPPGTVLAQAPPERKQDTCFVTLTVSDGTLVRVPPLKGLLRDQAKASTEDLKLRFQATDAPSDEPAGTVLGQKPPADTEVEIGSTVSVAIARPRDLDVPDVIGLLADAAEQKLSPFRIESVPEESDRPRGEVTNQDPRSPAKRRRGDTVRIFVSDASLVEVPDVTRVTVAEARRRLDALAAGLSVTTTARDDAAAPDSVIAQSPPPRTVVKRGSGVALELSLGLPVSSVIGLQLDAARTELARFNVSTEYVPDAAARDQVLAQDPAPLTRVAGGAAVILRVSDASRVVVPDVRTMTLAAARSALRAAGLDVQLGEGPGRDTAKVAQQTPPPAAIVSRGTKVRLDLEVFPLDWALIVAAALGLLGAGTAVYKYWTKLLKVEARIDLSAAPTQVGGAERAGPDIGIEARLERGDTTVKFSNGGKP